mgnify:CR=1 FL=1
MSHAPMFYCTPRTLADVFAQAGYGNDQAVTEIARAVEERHKEAETSTLEALDALCLRTGGLREGYEDITRLEKIAKGNKNYGRNLKDPCEMYRQRMSIFVAHDNGIMQVEEIYEEDNGPSLTAKNCLKTLHALKNPRLMLDPIDGMKNSRDLEIALIQETTPELRRRSVEDPGDFLNIDRAIILTQKQTAEFMTPEWVRRVQSNLKECLNSPDKIALGSFNGLDIFYTQKPYFTLVFSDNGAVAGGQSILDRYVMPEYRNRGISTATIKTVANNPTIMRTAGTGLYSIGGYASRLKALIELRHHHNLPPIPSDGMEFDILRQTIEREPELNKEANKALQAAFASLLKTNEAMRSPQPSGSPEPKC